MLRLLSRLAGKAVRSAVQVRQTHGPRVQVTLVAQASAAIVVPVLVTVLVLVREVINDFRTIAVWQLPLSYLRCDKTGRH